MASQPLPTRTDSPESIALACKWFADCANGHSLCKGIARAEWFPKRVLDLGTDQAADTIKLHVHNATHPPGPYMTLSYQWPSSEESSPRLTSKSFEALRQSIRLIDLPKVIKNAIFLTRKFGIRYLWIDRFCVIQDSTEDWSSQSAEMGLIYASAICSIAASDANDPTKGCFFTRNASALQPWRFAFPGCDELGR